ncbi:MAG: ATP-binding protein [Verrucomicrobiales bacterium]|nr:ATP-binding protein [Verrucomicrobiales bacterium]MCP5560903.1 ATP-binding protein [Verrucomicrobiaceae bacterium]
MKPIIRDIEKHLVLASKSFPATVITGPRRSGKTYLLRRIFPKAEYYLFEDPDVISRFRQDPQGFLDGVKPPAILDEIQNVPEVFNFVRSRIDAAPRKMGRWLLTGSQEAGLMHNVTESMAGRAAVLQLLPLSLHESPKVTPLLGGHPEVLAKPKAAKLWFSSYLQTYLERDVRAVSAVQDLGAFRRFMSLLATRHGQVLNKTDLAAPLGMSVPGVGKWLDILETTGQIFVIQPYFENFGKRIIRSPRIYIADSGMACHLLGIDTEAELEKSPFLGAIFEGVVAAEIIKSQVNAGMRRELYYFRDQQGLEVDFVLPGKNGSMTLIEAKAFRTAKPDMTLPMRRLATAWKAQFGEKRAVRSLLVHRPARANVASKAIAKDVEVCSWKDLATRIVT